MPFFVTGVLLGDVVQMVCKDKSLLSQYKLSLYAIQRKVCLQSYTINITPDIALVDKQLIYSK